MEVNQTQLRYPKTVRVNFRKLERPALIRILRHYGARARPESTHEELACTVARLFENRRVSDTDIVKNFSAKHCHSMADSSQITVKKRSIQDTESEPARNGEQVAAKVLRTNDDGSWILGNVLNFDRRTQIYEVQDEDDSSRVVQLAFSDVRRLDDTSGQLRKGDPVLAVFPDTTSFYRAVVAKNPKAPTHGNGSWEVVVRFDDDEDDTGKAPPRRVPARFVLRRDDVDFEENDDD